MSPSLPQVQLQDNSSDCGVFVLQYVESLLKVSQRNKTTSVRYYLNKRSSVCMRHGEVITHFLLHPFPLILLQSVKENRSLPSSPEAWASYEETNSKRTDIKSLITDFEKRRSQESKPTVS